ncbi:hypothetical protein HPP92_020676 [Vanilla planifolia]|uniref:Uncharacterized protein n=1 Tax=Vanilla planifolia TaxID=51239 RepID=A0A835PXG8_VANPL|nr:hypothetical protein HPP92_020676 [Vanilla planifolia]
MHGAGSGEGGRGVREESASTTATTIRKGPWMAEEDAVLMEYVRKKWPRDWSSIRSKGLLPRTGKSCRLRWVNKLKPDLKTGCKFSAEEEHIVIDLQARFGNKWARIATYLPGRTDNDVKNFWSTRQKRLARLLHTSLPSRSQRNQGKEPMLCEAPSFEQNPNSVALPCNTPGVEFIPFVQECSTGQCSHAPYVDNTDVEKTELMQNLPTINNQVLCLQSCSPPRPQFNHPILEMPLLPEGQDLVPEFGDLSFSNHFACMENSQSMQLAGAPTFFDLDVGGRGIKTEHPGTPESFFGDFPTDMFDCFEQPPAS